MLVGGIDVFFWNSIIYTEIETIPDHIKIRIRLTLYIFNDYNYEVFGFSVNYSEEIFIDFN